MTIPRISFAELKLKSRLRADHFRGNFDLFAVDGVPGVVGVIGREPGLGGTPTEEAVVTEEAVEAGVRVGRFLNTRGSFPAFRAGGSGVTVAVEASGVSGGGVTGEGATTLRSGTSAEGVASGLESWTSEEIIAGGSESGVARVDSSSRSSTSSSELPSSELMPSSSYVGTGSCVRMVPMPSV